ncbi:MAG: MGMT family protein [Anaerolineales bacterium]|jgi:methylated-DNA-protein-cysteine methyltransferase-like protein
MSTDRERFNQQVFEIVAAIPTGRLMTYGRIAALIPPPPGIDPLAYKRIRARWAGYAMADCPDELPWHRVVNAKGQISPRHGHGPHVQRQDLEEEGIQVSSKGRVDLKAFLWEPEARWLREHGLLDNPADRLNPPA